jgi:hypothetical protein
VSQLWKLVYGSKEGEGGGSGLGTLTLGIIAAIILFLFLNPITVIPAGSCPTYIHSQTDLYPSQTGHIGIIDFFGNVRPNTLPPGINIVNPLARVTLPCFL